MALEDLLAQSFDLEFLLRMLVGLAVGALIGLERERHRERRTVLAGVRTYPLAALAGVIFAQLGTMLEAPFFIAVGAIVFGAAALLLYWVRHTLGIHGLTSPMAFFATYLIGALIGLGFLLEGVVAGVATAVLLFTRTRLHRLAEVMTEREMAGALQFIIVAFILFPLVSDRPIDPLGVLNLHWLLLVVIFVSAISFVSFLVMRVLGASHGLAVSGFLGGLVNSEATTASLAGLARDREGLTASALQGIMLTNATMLVRNLAIAGFVAFSFAEPRFLALVAPALVFAFLAQSAFALQRARRGVLPGEETGSIRLGNPFAFGPALRFAVLFLLIRAFSLAILHVPGTGEAAVLLTAVGGLVSSAAVVATVGTSVVQDDLSPVIAAATAVLATLVSTLNKLVLVRAVHPPLVRPLVLRVVVPAVVGLAALAATLYLS